MSLSEEDLRRFVDGELDPLEQTRVEAGLAQDAAVQRRVTELRESDARLRALLLRGLTLPPNAELEPHAVRHRIEQRRAGYLRLAAAAGFALCLGAASGWYARGSAAPLPMQD